MVYIALKDECKYYILIKINYEMPVSLALEGEIFDWKRD